MLSWVAFGLSLSLVLGLARWSLWGAMLLGALVLGGITLPAAAVGEALRSVATSPSVVLLALAMVLIPVIGGVLVETGRMEGLLAGLPRPRKAVYALAPGILGMLPMPGGALLSAPLVERVGGAPPAVRAAANVWFRHTLHSIYPLSPALITGATLAGLDVWGLLPFQLPTVLVLLAIGYAVVLRRVSGRMETSADHTRWDTLAPVAILVAAPALDLALKRLAPLPVPELATVVGVAVSLAFASVGRVSVPRLVGVVRRERPLRFGLIVIAVFAYLAVFERSGLPARIAALSLPPAGLCVGAGWFLGFATGRQQAALSLVIPIYVGAFGTMTPWAFAVTYLATYLGYLLSPLHPCLTVSAEYASVPLGSVWRRLLVPSLLALLITAGSSLLIL
ncbi:MAG: TIGR00529 family membrane protein [Candidatus Bipolaricaulota bacterium]